MFHYAGNDKLSDYKLPCPSLTCIIPEIHKYFDRMIIEMNSYAVDRYIPDEFMDITSYEHKSLTKPDMNT